MRKTLSTLIMLTGAALSMPTALAADGETIFKGKPCVACHSVETKMIGPSFKEVAAKYAGQTDASSIIIQSMKAGSQNKWGAIPMPPNMLTDEEANALAEWILSQK